jgi:Ca-activated chloride channel homolog
VAFRPSWSDLPLRAAFPLFVANALAWFHPGVLGADAARYRTGETIEVGVPGDAREARVTGPDGSERTWPVVAGVLAYAGTSRVGFHRVEATEGSRDIAVSLCDPGETDLSARYAPGSGAADAAVAVDGEPAGEADGREPAWFAFALAGFFLVLAEGLFWSLARRGGAS